MMQPLIFPLLLVTCSLDTVSGAISCLSNHLGGHYDSLQEFSMDMCAQCYHFMDTSTLRSEFVVGKHKKWEYLPLSGRLVLQSVHGNSSTYRPKRFMRVDPERLNLKNPENDKILRMFRKSFYRDIFLGCCRDAVRCCNQTLIHLKPPKDGLYCPAKWDGWNCWPFAAAGQSITDICPEPAYQLHDHLPAKCYRASAIKTCTSDGSWLMKNGIEKTDYLACTYTGERNNAYRNHLRISLQAVSLIASVISCMIFLVYKQYHILRIKVHLNFFLSFIITSTASILFNTTVTNTHFDSHKDNVISKNQTWCIVFYVFYRTASLTNYGWMLCEGIYLHKLIVAAFREQKRMMPFYVLGWFLPIAATIPYCIINSLPAYNRKCWTQTIPLLAWIYSVVPLTALFGNLILLCNIIRVLFTKLMSSPDHFRSALRATFILIFIFGVHYLFFLLEPTLSQSCDVFSIILLYLGIAFASLQGAITATILCFCNSEVHSLIRRSLQRYMTTFKSEVTEGHNMVNASGK